MACGRRLRERIDSEAHDTVCVPADVSYGHVSPCTLPVTGVAAVFCVLPVW